MAFADDLLQICHTGKSVFSSSVINYIVVDIKNRIRLDHYRFSPNKFRSMWCHAALCDFHNDDNFIFKF